MNNIKPVTGLPPWDLVEPVPQSSGQASGSGTTQSNVNAPPLVKAPKHPGAKGTMRTRMTAVEARRIAEESGPSILKAKAETGFTAATSIKEKMVHAWATYKGERTPADKLTDFVVAVVDDPDSKGAQIDPVDASYRQYSAGVGGQGKAAVLSVSLVPDAPMHVNAFGHELAKNPGLELAVRELKDRGWAISYGKENTFDPVGKTVTIASGDPASAIASLWKSLSTLVFPDGTQPTVAMVETTHNYFLLHDPTRGAYKHFYKNRLKRFDKGDGLYNAVSRKLDTGTDGHFDPNQLPGVAKHDAVMVMLLRETFSATNTILRTGSDAAKKNIAPFVAEINKSLERFPPYAGMVVRKIGGRPVWWKADWGKIPAATIQQRYANNANNVITEPAFLSASKLDKNDRVPKDDFGGNVRFFINSTSARDLKSLNPHSEILFGTDTRVLVLDVQYKKGTETSAYPKADITLDQDI